MVEEVLGCKKQRLRIDVVVGTPNTDENSRYEEIITSETWQEKIKSPENELRMALILRNSIEL